MRIVDKGAHEEASFFKKCMKIKSGGQKYGVTQTLCTSAIEYFILYGRVFFLIAGV